MMPTTRTYTSGMTGAQDPVALDYEPLSKITAVVSPVVGMDVLVEVTLDNVFDPDASDYVAPASARWHTVAFAPTNAAGYITFDGPWRAIRLNITTNGNGIIFQVGQAVTPRA
jgi:hypothetical protein